MKFQERRSSRETANDFHFETLVPEDDDFYDRSFKCADATPDHDEM